MNLSLNEIFAVIDKVKIAELDGFEYSDADMKIKIKNGSGKAYRKGNPVSETQNLMRMEEAVGTSLEEESVDSEINKCSEVSGRKNIETDNLIFVESPMVGTFYVAPSEGAAPFVSVGDNVKKGQVIGIIEAMKLMNEIEVNEDGIVEAVLVENETMVEFGQPLLKIRKKG